MMKVPLDVLQKLAAKPIVEAEGYGLKFFKEFDKVILSAWNDVKQENAEHYVNPSNYDAECYIVAYQRVKRKFLKKHCPPVRFISEGSSRAAYALNGGLCLKIAENEAGAAQNKAEAKNMNNAKGLDIFPQLHAVGSKWLSMLVDCVTPCEDVDAIIKQFSESIAYFDWKTDMFDFPTEPIGLILERIVDQLPNDWKAMLKEYIEDKSNDPRLQKVAKMMLRPKNAGQKMLNALAEWTAKNSRDFAPEDLEGFYNWGLAVRNGEIVPVVLDAGFSEEVRDEFY